MPFPPNLFLVGAQKAGTTYLATLLDQHNDICVSFPKEPGYFTHNRSKNIEWYSDRFSNLDARYLLDATVGYSTSPLPGLDKDLEDSPFWGIPRKIRAMSPDARILYLTRDPVVRAHSAYWHDVRAGHQTKPFRQAIAEESTYLRTGRYFDQLALYREHFPRDRIFLMTFEEFTESPQEVINRCVDFLELQRWQINESEQGRNRSFQYRQPLALLNRLLGEYGGLNRLAKMVRPWVPNQMQNWLFERLTDRVPKLAEEDRRWLSEYFQEQNLKFASEYGIDISRWSTPDDGK